MFKLLFVIFTLTVGSYGSKTGSSHYLSVRYDLIKGYYDLPTTLKQMRKHYHKYKHAGHDSDLNVDLYSYEHDPRVFVMFDRHGNIGGLRIGLIKEDISARATKHKLPFEYDIGSLPQYSSGKFWNKAIWYTDVLFISPDQLKAGGRDKTNGVVAESLYLKLDGKWTWISKDECQAESIGFTKQGCYFGMGEHYYYNMKPDTDCSKIDGTFLLFESGRLVGLGFSPFGTFTSTKQRIWFEDPQQVPIKIIIPHGPPCLLDWLDKYGLISFHIFFEEYPRFTSCLWPWQKKSRCKHN